MKKNGIIKRLEDSRSLLLSKRFEGSLLVTLVAVAASSKLENPGLNDKDAFVSYLEGSIVSRVSAEFRGEVHSLSYILYKWLRCNLVHEADIPPDINFVKSSDDGLFVRAGGAPSYTLLISENLIDKLVDIIKHKTIDKN